MKFLFQDKSILEIIQDPDGKYQNDWEGLNQYHEKALGIISSSSIFMNNDFYHKKYCEVQCVSSTYGQFYCMKVLRIPPQIPTCFSLGPI